MYTHIVYECAADDVLMYTYIAYQCAADEKKDFETNGIKSKNDRTKDEDRK